MIAGVSPTFLREQGCREKEASLAVSEPETAVPGFPQGVQVSHPHRNRVSASAINALVAELPYLGGDLFPAADRAAAA